MTYRLLTTGLLIATALHGVAIWQIAYSGIEAQDAGVSVSEGDNGTDVGLGQLGSYANASERLQQLNKPEPVKPVISEPLPLKKPESVTPAQKNSYKQEQVKNRTPRPEEKRPPDTQKQDEQREQYAATESEEQPEVLPEDQPEQNASTAMVKATGREEQQQSGGKRGSAKSYITDLYQWLAKHRTYPPTAKKSKQEGTVMLAFTISRDGTVQKSSIKNSSGHPLLDEAAIRMLKKASPLPAAPDDFYPLRDTLPLVMPIEFSLITNKSFGD